MHFCLCREIIMPDMQTLFFRYPALSFLLLALMVSAMSGCNWFQKKDLLQAPFFKTDMAVVESALDGMNTEQKAGQMILALTNDEPSLGRLRQDAARGLLGGAVVRGLAVEQFIAFSDSLRNSSPWPLMMGASETGLLNNQFCDAVPFPGELVLSACAAKESMEKIRDLFRMQAALTGINLSFGPVLYPGAAWDPRTQMPNDQYALPAKQVRGWSQEGMIRLGLSFSHLAYIPNDTSGLTARILSPYRRLARAGISGFWIAPELIKPNAPRNQLRNYFRTQVGFDGLLAGAGDVELLALAGADLIVYEGDPAEARRIIVQLVRQRKISGADLNQRVRRILAAKYWSTKKREAARSAVLSDSLLAAAPDTLFNNEDLSFQAGRLWGNSPVVLQDGAQALPLAPEKYRAIELADKPLADFWGRVEKYADFDSIVPLQMEESDTIFALDTTNLPLVLAWDSGSMPAAADTAFFHALHAYADSVPVVLVHFGDAARLALADTTMTIIHVFERNEYTERGAANILFGAQAASAVLPDAVGLRFAAGAGLSLPKVSLKYGLPREEGISPEKLVGIDAIAGSAIDRKIIPGCQVLVAQNGNIIYSKSFGKHSYNGGPEVTQASLYDIASITKVAATTLVMMQLKDAGKVALDNPVRQFIPSAKGKNGNITLRQLLTHTSGLQPSLPIAAYVRSPLARRRACSSYFCKTPQRGYRVEVAKDLYFKDALRTSLLNSLYRLPVSSRGGVRYSDVNMVILQQILEKASGRSLDRYAREAFYKPLGLQRTTFLPRKYFSLDEIAPTENDTRWRRQIVHGYVHDPAAALLGGVAGHAGLFSTAEDLAVIFQLLLDEGSYGGRQYIDPATVKLFTGSDSKSKRGLGFDKPRPVKHPSFSSKIAAESFGHTGFTGTCVWVDPNRKLVYIFLSNRVHPKAQNAAFLQNNIRKRIHEVIYEALDTYEPGWGIAAAQ